MSTPADNRLYREPPGPWLDRAISVYGEPRIRVDEPQKYRDEGNNRFEKRCWVWFVNTGGRKVNHHVAITRYPRKDGDRWEVLVGSHLGSMARVTHEALAEPDDELMGRLFDVVGFLSTPVAAAHASPNCACGINDAGQRYVDPICREP